jgi:hypothetical protein
VFDGRWIYFVDATCCTYLTRFDSRAAFDAPASWSNFEMSTVNSGPLGFSTGIFDGRYVYLVPYGQGMFNGLISRYDTFARPATARAQTANCCCARHAVARSAVGT